MLRSSNDWPPLVTHMRRRASRCRRLRRQQAARAAPRYDPRRAYSGILGRLDGRR